VTIEEIGPNTEKSKYTLLPREENIELCQCKKVDKILFKAIEKFIYFGTTPTNQYCVLEETKSRLNSVFLFPFSPQPFVFQFAF
jgi:hypothetical protein